jgi:hypothetical protein
MRFITQKNILATALLSIMAGSSIANADDDNVRPAPASIGSVVPLTYFGPAPSSVDPRLIGPHQLLTAGQVNLNRLTVKLPLYKGLSTDGKTYWYILTDSNDQANAEALGLNFSGKLTYADTGRGVRNAVQLKDGTVQFLTENSGVDFSPKRRLTPGAAPNFFPPTLFKPGSVGEENYSPLMRIQNNGGYIYNAPIISQATEAQLNVYCDGKTKTDKTIVHDKVRSICPAKGTVELDLTLGFTFSRPLLYLSLEASHELPATMEEATYAPALQDIGVGRDDSAFSPVERLFAVTNGPIGKTNPQRQGFNSALAGDGYALNVLGGIPTVATDYSPLWDVNAAEWTQDAIAKGYRSRVLGEFELLGLVLQGWLTGPGGAKFGSTGFIVNCPPVMRLL